MQPPKVQLFELPKATRPSAPRFEHSPFLKQSFDPMRLDAPVVRSSTICGVEGDPPPPPPPGDDGPKFTQKDVDSIVGKRVDEVVKKKYGNYDQLVQQVADLSPLKTQVEELLAEKAKQGKTAEEIQRMEADKAARLLQRQQEESTTKLTAAEKRAEAYATKLRERDTAAALGQALDAAKVLTSARAQAIRLMAGESTIELDDDGKVTSIVYGGVTHKTVEEAATAFLKTNDFLASAGSPAGGGTKRPNGGGTGRPLHEMSEDELLRAANRAPR